MAPGIFYSIKTHDCFIMEKKILTSYHTVASYEMDSFGHVNNAVYLNYLEKARGDFLEARGLAHQDFFKWKRFPVLVKAEMTFKRPAVSGDRLFIRGWVTEHSRIGFTLSYEILQIQSDQCVLEAKTRLVFIDEKGRPSRIPQEFKDKFIT